MKSSSFFISLFLGFVWLHSIGYGQAINSLKGQPNRPGYANFHSNLGLQEIIEVGVPVMRGQISQPDAVVIPKSIGLGDREGKETEIIASKPEVNIDQGWFTKKEAEEKT